VDLSPEAAETVILQTGPPTPFQQPEAHKINKTFSLPLHRLSAWGPALGVQHRHERLLSSVAVRARTFASARPHVY